MILLGIWGRNYIKGNLVAFPANAWTYYETALPTLHTVFDGLQLPPASITQSGKSASGDGYGVFCYRDLDGTYWGNKADLAAMVKIAHHYKMKVYGDFPFRQMDGENHGPGVFTYTTYAGSTSPSWFSYYGQPGETMPPFVAQDDIPDTEGSYPDGRIRSFQYCIPPGVVEADDIDILNNWRTDIGYDGGRIDEAKALHAQSIARIIATQPKMDFYAEYMDGNPQALLNYACNDPMNSNISVEDYTLYWHLQQACNNYNAKLLNSGGCWGFFQYRPDLAVGFAGNPDVTPSRGPDNTISEQIAFNLGIAYALLLNLPMRLQIVDTQAYWPESDTFPNCYGLKPIIDNICWFSHTFSIGAWAVRWLDHDIAAYTRDGDGGKYGWSGGCAVVVNFNTSAHRTITMHTMWGPGKWIHDYSHNGGATTRDFNVNNDGTLTVTMQPNTNSKGVSFCLLAPGGVGV